MIAIARPKKPLELQTKHLTQEERAELEYRQELIKTNSDQLEKSPKWLRDKIARNEWKRLVEQFRTISVISNLDLNNLGAYCNAYSSYIETTKLLKDEPLTIQYTNKGGATNIIENPLIKIQMKYSDEMRKYSSLLGLSIDSRLKLASIKSTETKKELTDEFWDI
ncbi:phage terminase small subunit P27 family [Clostridium massiliamazoniense]|uniref:phage terminase small subunit P27 family n=1 Tax=Clostridium massiliamazoniense TaxID=1347366 RepID=UPI000A47DF35|nr:phage terminase small subunit P27 family [Clostridium massiliamazoniense]